MINQAIKYEIIENIGIIKGTNPPVNALSIDVRKGLINALNLFIEDDNIKGIILCRRQNIFCRSWYGEFANPGTSKFKWCNLAFENSNKPIVVALHGTLGGGLEFMG